MKGTQVRHVTGASTASAHCERSLIERAALADNLAHLAKLFRLDFSRR
jgi:hypothetical protein